VALQRDRLLLGAAGRAWAGALLAACVVVVGALGVLLRHQTQPTALDRAVDSPFITALGPHHSLLFWMEVPGTLVPAIVVSVVIAAGCVLAGRLNGALLALTAVPVATGLDDGLLKHAVDRTYLGQLTFPSGHTTAVVAVAATLAVLLLVPPQDARTRTARVALAAVAFAVVGVVAVAVMALQWHYFTDTVAGAAVGAGTVCAISLVLDLAYYPAVSAIQARTRASSRQAS
jgi:membrane-associated phospholipid phosphatase